MEKACPAKLFVPGWSRPTAGRRLVAVLVDRCWICLEQPAVTTVQSSDGRRFPACDICAVDHPEGPPAGDGPVTDADLRRIVGDTA